jgi:hypothetical protein
MQQSKEDDTINTYIYLPVVQAPVCLKRKCAVDYTNSNMQSDKEQTHHFEEDLDDRLRAIESRLDVISERLDVKTASETTSSTSQAYYFSLVGIIAVFGLLVVGIEYIKYLKQLNGIEN